ncbi:tRNA lysidine(34) synthetase TilS [Pseudochelatococcus sp. B33]
MTDVKDIPSVQDIAPLLRDPRRSPFDTVADDAIGALFAPLSSAPGLVLAVSGGPDSLALLLLAARWRTLCGQTLRGEAADGPAFLVASVDHGLRPSAVAEARAVAGLAGRLGFEARVLAWRGDKPRHGVQEAAREARYRLLAEAAREIGASHVVTAHHRDDQAETVLMRLAGGSGVGGLAAMRPLAALAGGAVLLARPLLGLPKERLVAVAREAGVAAVDDPANRDPRFARARLRGLEAERAALGLSTGRLAKLAERCARADDALTAIAAGRFAALADADADNHHAGRLTLSAELWREPEEVVLRVMMLAVVRVTERAGRPVPLERLERLVQDMRLARESAAGLRRTLHGATVRLLPSGETALAREPPRRRGTGPAKAGDGG